ncbi:hypothetical protein ACN28S_24540 [Cystobacter fuscus]
MGPLSPGVVLNLPTEVLEDLLWQLITNAAQHGGEGVRVRLEAEGGSEGEGWWCATTAGASPRPTGPVSSMPSSRRPGSEGARGSG